MDLLAEIQKWGGGGVVGLAVYCFLRLREQRSADARGERADDRDDRKTEVDGFERLAERLGQQLDLCLTRCAALQTECDGKSEEIEKLRDQLRTAQFDYRQLETKVHGFAWMEEGEGITPHSLRRLADRLESRDRGQQ